TAWRFSYATSVRAGAQVLLTQKGKPVLVKKGNVYWSGMNLPFHYVNTYSYDEAELMKNIVSELVTLGSDNRGNVEGAEFLSPRKVQLQGENARGVLFREQLYRGWQAEVSVNGGSLTRTKIYPTGPTFPGFMYVPLPKEAQSGKYTVIFNYRGFSPWGWFYRFIIAVILLSVFDSVVLGNKLWNRRILAFWQKMRRKTGKWWEKEDEY
ncbi:MAG TPA: hypothetical protein VJ179_01470, partial [Patescibacteria group bacterium]|nr:hypothetical protein [Patescibacteria group bacterium]